MSLSLIETVRRRGVPAVGIVGDEWMHWGPRADAWMRTFRRFPPARIAGGLLGLPTRVNLGSAAIWLFNSETVRRKALEAQPGLNDARVAHPGIDEVLFRPAERSPWAWKLLYLGRMDRRKGVHLAIEALATLPCEATLTLQGSGDDAYAQELRELAAKIGVADRVRYSACPRERLPDVYAAADAVLFPVQWDEPWGLVPLEAMAVGRPVIASGTGGSAEYLRHEENCLVYQPRGSADALAAQVRRLAEDEELRETIVTHGFTTATRFTEDLYNEAILSATEEAATGAKVAA
jgi:glycosyltransferase involved in cell wall biosynthesis